MIQRKNVFNIEKNWFFYIKLDFIPVKLEIIWILYDVWCSAFEGLARVCTDLWVLSGLWQLMPLSRQIVGWLFDMMISNPSFDLSCGKVEFLQPCVLVVKDYEQWRTKKNQIRGPSNTMTPHKHNKYVQRMYVSIVFQCFWHIFITRNENVHCLS